MSGRLRCQARASGRAEAEGGAEAEADGTTVGLITACQAFRRWAKSDEFPDRGRFYRSDQFSFARVGVPGLNLKAGVDAIGKPPGFGQSKYEDYKQHYYHSPADEVQADWDLSGAAQDMTDLYRVGLELAGTRHWPEWRADSEFRAIRAASLPLAH